MIGIGLLFMLCKFVEEIGIVKGGSKEGRELREINWLEVVIYMVG